MYLSDRDLTALLPQLEIQGPADGPFKPEDQVQPSSIDLRLGTVFWRPRKRFTLDLQRSRLLEVQPRRYYRREDVSFGRAIVIAPNELLLARTLEQFSVPNGYAAELTGRSSFARLGLMVNVTGGYINPGWRGYMTLQLVNFSPNPIRLMPMIPICQLRIVKLTSLADRPYGDPALQSVYVNDDGGPSYWWRDKRVKLLHDALADKSIEFAVQKEIYDTIGPQEPEVIERMEAYISKLRTGDLSNARSLLEGFSIREERRRTMRRWLINIARGSFTIGITSSLWVANKIPVRWWHFVVWSVALCLVFISLYAFRTEVGDHFGSAELRKCCPPT